MANKKLIVGNMKMNLTLDEVKSYIEDMVDDKDCVICPSYLYLPYFIEAGYTVGTQSIAKYEDGAYTGEISAHQAKSLGVTYTIIGHSERREYLNEDDSIVRAKINLALSNQLKVILCVGETLEERETSKTKDKIKHQLLEDLDGVTFTNENLIIAYEPIWAIGTGKVPTNEEIDDVVTYIKDIVKDNYQVEPMVLYGGSTNDKNIEQLSTISSVDGFLVGGACLVPEKFIKIIRATK